MAHAGIHEGVHGVMNQVFGWLGVRRRFARGLDRGFVSGALLANAKAGFFGRAFDGRVADDQTGLLSSVRALASPKLDSTPSAPRPRSFRA